MNSGVSILTQNVSLLLHKKIYAEDELITYNHKVTCFGSLFILLWWNYCLVATIFPNSIFYGLVGDRKHKAR